jgi:predicted PurR-regulated permease PerM
VTVRTQDTDQAGKTVDLVIQVALLALLTAGCFAILRPFLATLAWGVIIAVAATPGYRKLSKLLGGRDTLAAVLLTVCLLALLILPVALLAGTFVDGIEMAATHLKEGSVTIPPFPDKVASWPIVGSPLKELWTKATTDVSAVVRTFAPQIKAMVPGLLSMSAGIGLTVLQFVVSVIVGGFLLAYGRGSAEFSHRLARRVFDDRGPEIEEIITSTIRSVTTGILGVALIQTILATIGFVVVGLPGVGIWAMVFLFAAILQIGVAALIPAVGYAFMTKSSTAAAVFLVWCAIVGLSDNVLKPILLGRNAPVPIVVVFLGVIGGFMAMGIIGLFVGAIVLSVSYKLLLVWISPPAVSPS